MGDAMEVDSDAPSSGGGRSRRKETDRVQLFGFSSYHEMVDSKIATATQLKDEGNAAFKCALPAPPPLRPARSAHSSFFNTPAAHVIGGQRIHPPCPPFPSPHARAGDFKAALVKYHHIMFHVKGLDESSNEAAAGGGQDEGRKPTPAQHLLISALVVAHHRNIAATLLKLADAHAAEAAAAQAAGNAEAAGEAALLRARRLERAAAACDALLNTKFSPGDPKALFLRARANMQREGRFLDAAVEDLLLAAQKEPQDAAIRCG